VPSDTWVVAAPMKIEGGTGGLLRVLALAPVLTSRGLVVIRADAMDGLKNTAPSESELGFARMVDTTKVGVLARIAPSFATSDRAAELEARLSRALFRAQLDDAAWKAPPWPAR